MLLDNKFDPEEREVVQHILIAALSALVGILVYKLAKNKGKL